MVVSIMAMNFTVAVGTWINGFIVYANIIDVYDNNMVFAINFTKPNFPELLIALSGLTLTQA